MDDNNKQDFTIEEGFEKLDSIIQKMESEEISLEDSFELYNQGLDIMKMCSQKIDTVEKKIKLIEDNEDGE